MTTDLLCFSQLRWDFVVQRPHHLMRRAARDRRVTYVEEPVLLDRSAIDTLRVSERDGITVVTPILADEGDVQARVVAMLRDHAARREISRAVHWLQTPMALPWSEALDPGLVVYDCMDDLTGFAGAPRRLREREDRLLERADLVLTGGVSQLARISDRRPDAVCLPSSVDTRHFARARELSPPVDVAELPRPRFGYVGVIDERIDMGLIAALADAQPSGSVILIGPVAKIDASAIPDRHNVHRLGPRDYDGLPAYLGALDVGIMPFAHNRATRYISPTKTPEYLAAGLPVASTSIADVVSPYGRLGLVEIGDGPGFVSACRRALRSDLASHRAFARDFLRPRSWDETWLTVDRHLQRLMRSARAAAVTDVPMSMPVPAASAAYASRADAG